MSIAAQVLIFAATALGLNIVVGLAGLLDLGYIAFLGAGAFTAAILSKSAFATFLPWFKPPFIVVVLISGGIAAILGLIATGTIVAVNYWGLPDWVPVSRPTFAASQPDLVLDFPPDQQDRRQLPNGTEFFGASGSITNVGAEARSVPPILKRQSHRSSRSRPSPASARRALRWSFIAG